MDLERVTVRVAQLLRLARDQPERPEGILAGQVARQIMEKYGIEVQLTDAASTKTKLFFRTFRNSKMTLSQILINLLACATFEIPSEQREEGGEINGTASIYVADDPLVPLAQKLGDRLHSILLRETKRLRKGFDENDQAWVLGAAAMEIFSAVGVRLQDLSSRWDDDDDDEIVENSDEECKALVRYKSKISMPQYEAPPPKALDPSLTEIPRRAGSRVGCELVPTMWDVVRRARREAGFPC